MQSYISNPLEAADASFGCVRKCLNREHSASFVFFYSLDSISFFVNPTKTHNIIN
jgi:hypothetical protein